MREKIKRWKKKKKSKGVEERGSEATANKGGSISKKGILQKKQRKKGRKRICATCQDKPGAARKT